MIKWVFRWLFRLLILLVVLFVAAILLLDTIAREITENRIQRQTGLEVKIGKMRVGILEPRLTIENLVIYNSAEFGGSPLLDLPELHLECDHSLWFSSNHHFKLIRFNLARLNVVEDAKGQKNLDVLEKRWQKTDVASSVTSPVFESKGGTNSFPKIDVLNLSLGRATYMNMKNPGQVDELKLDVRNQVYENVTSEAQLNNILLVIMLSRQNMLGPEGQRWLTAFGLQKKK
jgi:hypothetical protein